ncbi:MAG: hypothetical protein SGBAC_007946 [Bacillariaceae sp.]
MASSMRSLLMAILMVFANSGIHASAWMVTSTEASVATADKSLKDHDFISSSQNINRMYVEAPPALPLQQKLPFVFHDLDITKLPFLNIFAPPQSASLPPPTSETSSEAAEAAWSHSIQDDSVPCTYKPIWDWQTEYFQEHLTNYQEMELPDPSLAVVQTSTDQFSSASASSASASTRVRTKWYSSEEYRLIRMTYMDGGDRTQIFTTVCYPRANLPILGHGLLQVGDRRITISDFQPLEESHAKYADRYLRPIKDQYPSLGQEMSERFFQQGEFWSDSTLLGRFSKNTDDDKSLEDEMWKDLWPAYKACVQTHVQLCQEQEQEKEQQEPRNHRIPNTDPDDSLLLQKHAEYDAHVASRDPAIKMLTGIFGEETATKVVYEALFPLANPPSAPQ